jgi:hypothetical protein
MLCLDRADALGQRLQEHQSTFSVRPILARRIELVAQQVFQVFDLQPALPDLTGHLNEAQRLAERVVLSQRRQRAGVQWLERIEAGEVLQGN